MISFADPGFTSISAALLRLNCLILDPNRLPQLAEANTPRLMDAAGEFSMYDEL
jgi:hypothetical protein